ncbi:MAG: cytochrome C [Chitinophagaceae bacterium]|nr:cytochrome C [Chitinophagaceae bacterium]
MAENIPVAEKKSQTAQQERSHIIVFLDDEPHPLGSFKSPINFELDTTRLVDGKHTLKIVSKDPHGKEGVKIIPFIVRNGPDISVEGLSDNQVVNGTLPMMINAYSKGDSKVFLIESSEVPRSIPGWIWIVIILFGAWALYYLIVHLYNP